MCQGLLVNSIMIAFLHVGDFLNLKVALMSVSDLSPFLQRLLFLSRPINQSQLINVMLLLAREFRDIVMALKGEIYIYGFHDPRG